MTPLVLAVLALASFRLTTLFVTDTILDRPRNALHRRFPITDTYVDEKPRNKRVKAQYVNASEPKWFVSRGTFIGDLTSCYFCLGVWVSVGLGLAWRFADWSHLPIWLVAITGGQLLLSQWSNR